MASRFSYRVSELARKDLNDIVTYIALALSNFQGATNFIEAFNDAIDRVRDFSEMGFLTDNEFLGGIQVRKVLIGDLGNI